MINHPVQITLKNGIVDQFLNGFVSFYFSPSFRSYLLIIQLEGCDGEIVVSMTHSLSTQTGFALSSYVALPNEYDLPYDAVSVDWLWLPDCKKKTDALRFFVSSCIVRSFTRIKQVEHASWSCSLERTSAHALVTSIICEPQQLEGRVVVHYSNGSDWDTGIYGDMNDHRRSGGLKRLLAWVKRCLG